MMIQRHDRSGLPLTQARLDREAVHDRIHHVERMRWAGR